MFGSTSAAADVFLNSTFTRTGKRGGKAKGGSSNDEKASGDEYDWKDEDSENGGDGNGTKEAAKTFSRRKPRTSERPSAAAD